MQIPAQEAPTLASTAAPPVKQRAAEVAAVAPSFQDMLVKREEKSRRKKLEARGKTIGDTCRSDNSSLASTIADDDNDSVVFSGSIGIGKYTKKLAETRKSVFHKEPPKILKVFEYENHEQIVEQVCGGEAYENFLSNTPANRSWRNSSAEFFKHGRIGSKNDDTTIFADSETDAQEMEFRRQLTQMSAKERRLAYKQSRNFIPPPIVPSFTRDASFLEDPRRKSKKPHYMSEAMPSIFDSHPYDKFLSRLQRPPPEQIQVDQALQNRQVEDDEMDSTVQSSDPPPLPTPLVENSRQVEWAAHMLKKKADALEEWGAMHSPTMFSTNLSHLKQQQKEQGADDVSVDTFTMIYGSKEELRGYRMHETTLDESLYFGEAARLRFYGKYHQLSELIKRQGGDTSDGECSKTNPSVRPMQQHHFSLSPRTRFITRFIETFNKMPLPVIIRPLSEDQDPLLPPSSTNIETELNLAKMALGDEYILLLAETLTELPRLESLNLEGNCLTDRSMSVVVQVLEHISTITELTLSDNKIDSLTARSLSRLLLSPNSTIRTLRLSSADFDDSEVALFMQCFSKNRSVSHLDFSRNRVGGSSNLPTAASSNKGKDGQLPVVKCGGCEAIATALANSRTLSYLSLNWNSIGPSAATFLSRGIAESHSLCELHLAYNCIKDPGAEAIGGALLHNKSLQHLDLSGNQITFSGCFVLSWALRVNQALRVLDLSSNPVGYRGARAIMRTLNYPCNQLENSSGDKKQDDRIVIFNKCTFGEAVVDPNGSSSNGSIAHNHASSSFKITNNFAVDPCFPAGEYVLDLSRNFDRCLAMELVEQAATRRGCSLKRIIHTAAPVRSSDKPKPSTLSLVAPPRHLELRGCALCPWRHSAPHTRNPYSQLNANEWANLLSNLRLLDSKTGLPWVLPSSGTLLLDVAYEPRVARAIELLNATGLRRLLLLVVTSASSDAGLRLSDLWTMSSDLFLECHQLEQLLAKIPGRKRRYDQIDMLAKLLPCITDVANTEPLLRRFFGNDHSALSEIRHKLSNELFYLCLNAPTGHFKLDMSSPYDRLAAVRLCEIDNEENAYTHRAMPQWAASHHHGFTSQWRNRSNFRNEIMSGKARIVEHVSSLQLSALAENVADSGDPSDSVLPSKPRPHQSLNIPGYFSRGLLDRFPGTLEFDFVSTTRPAEATKTLSDRDMDDMLIARGLRSGAEVVASAFNFLKNSFETEEDRRVGEIEASAFPLLKTRSAQPHNLRGRWITSGSLSTALPDSMAQTRADVAADRAALFVDSSGAYHRFVFRAVVRVHSPDLTVLSFSDAERAQQALLKTSKRNSRRAFTSKSSTKGKGKGKGKGKSKGKDKDKRKKETKTKDGQSDSDDCDEGSANASEDDDDDEDDVFGGGEVDLEGINAAPESSVIPTLGSSRQSSKKRDTAGSGPPGCVLEACLAFEHQSDLGADSAPTRHVGVGPSSNHDIINQNLVSPMCPWLSRHCWKLFHDSLPEPTHNRFNLEKENPGVGWDVAVKGSEILLEMPISLLGDDKTTQEEFVQERLRSLFGGFIESLEPLEAHWTHNSTVESEGGDELTGATSSASGGIALQVITLRLDCCLPRLPYARHTGFKAHHSNSNNAACVWRWRAVRADDRDALAPYCEREGTWSLSIADNEAEVDARINGPETFCCLAPSHLPRCWTWRLAVFRHSFGHIWITSAQAARLVRQWPLALREDMAVYLFPRIADIENFNDVVDACYPHAGLSTPLYRRLGFLNAVSLFQIEGRFFNLRLYVPEERMLAHSIVLLEMTEPGKLFKDERFKRDEANPFIPGWELPASWVSRDKEAEVSSLAPFEGIPKSGNFVLYTRHLHHSSGSLNATDPDVAQRRLKAINAGYLVAVPRGDGGDLETQTTLV